MSNKIVTNTAQVQNNFITLIKNEPDKFDFKRSREKGEGVVLRGLHFHKVASI